MSTPTPATDAPTGAPRTTTRRSATGVLLRFISCGLVSIAIGVLWRFTLAPQRIGIGSALAGILFLLLGFIIGGLGWYTRDVRLRMRNPEAVDDDRLVFSFIVFAVMPFAVLLVVGAVWLIALLIGVSA